MPLVKVSISNVGNNGNHGNHGIGGKEVVPSDQWDRLRSNTCCDLIVHPLNVTCSE